jgi:hypothetical protein
MARKQIFAFLESETAILAEKVRFFMGFSVFFASFLGGFLCFFDHFYIIFVIFGVFSDKKRDFLMKFRRFFGFGAKKKRQFREEWNFGPIFAKLAANLMGKFRFCDFLLIFGFFC